MSNYITIPLSKTGKHAGKYETIVSEEDKDLLDLNWTVHFGKLTNYVSRSIHYGNICKKQRLHIVILERMIGRPLEKGELVDHIDGNGLNNQRSNLRIATYTQNRTNSILRYDSKTGFKGVTYCPNTDNYMARIQIDGKRKYLGHFPTREEAHKAYCKEADRLHKEFANYGKFEKKE